MLAYILTLGQIFILPISLFLGHCHRHHTGPGWREAHDLVKTLFRPSANIWKDTIAFGYQWSFFYRFLSVRDSTTLTLCTRLHLAERAWTLTVNVAMMMLWWPNIVVLPVETPSYGSLRSCALSQNKIDWILLCFSMMPLLSVKKPARSVQREIDDWIINLEILNFEI